MCIICRNEITFDSEIDEMDISWCNDVQSIPMMKGLKKLWCQGCPKMEHIPDIPGLKDIRCYKSGIIVVQGFKELEFIDCCDCLDLIHISDNPCLKTIFCVRCPELLSIANVPETEFVSCSDCQKLSTVPDRAIEYMESNHPSFLRECKWLKSTQNANYHENIQKVIVLQRWFRNVSMSKRLSKIIKMIIPIYYHPDAKGGYFDKKRLTDFFNGL
jgi:hypothetical protein